MKVVEIKVGEKPLPYSRYRKLYRVTIVSDTGYRSNLFGVSNGGDLSELSIEIAQDNFMTLSGLAKLHNLQRENDYSYKG